MKREEIQNITNGCVLYSTVWRKSFRISNLKVIVTDNFEHASFTAIEELPYRPWVQLSFPFRKAPSEPRQKIEGLCCSHCCMGSWKFKKEDKE
jgi:hypothetical protein